MSYTVEDEENRDKNKKTIWTVISISIIFVGFGYIYIISKNTKSKSTPQLYSNQPPHIQRKSINRSSGNSELKRRNSESIVRNRDIRQPMVQRRNSEPIVRQQIFLNRDSSGELSSSIGSDDSFYSITNSIGEDSFHSFTGSNKSDSTFDSYLGR